MRPFVIIPLLTAVVLAGCDPGGLRRVQVRLAQPPNDGGTIVLNQPDVRQAVRVLDKIAEPLGFKVAPEQATNGYIQVYMLSRPPAIVDGRSYPRDVRIRITTIPTGIEVAFGEFGFLASTPEPAVRAFKDARAAFISRYGSRNVKTRTFGSANQQGGANGRQPFSSQTNQALAAAASRRSP